MLFCIWSLWRLWRRRSLDLSPHSHRRMAAHRRSFSLLPSDHQHYWLSKLQYRAKHSASMPALMVAASSSAAGAAAARRSRAIASAVVIAAGTTTGGSCYYGGCRSAQSQAAVVGGKNNAGAAAAASATASVISGRWAWRHDNISDTTTAADNKGTRCRATTPAPTAATSLAHAGAGVSGGDSPPDTPARRPLVVGLAGCTASGKSTLCEAIVARQGGAHEVAVVTLDEFWAKKEDIPLLPKEWLAAHPTMAKLKIHDTNVPAAIDWVAAEARVREVIATATVAGTPMVIIEGFLLFSQPALVALLDKAVYLTVADSDKQTLMMRKFTRDHLGKKSYQARGVSMQEYAVYFEECVIDRFEAHGKARPVGTVDLPCMMPTIKQVAKLAQLIELPLPRRKHK